MAERAVLGIGVGGHAPLGSRARACWSSIFRPTRLRVRVCSSWDVATSGARHACSNFGELLRRWDVEHLAET